jgi:hypothetical protein
MLQADLKRRATAEPPIAVSTLRAAARFDRHRTCRSRTAAPDFVGIERRSVVAMLVESPARRC